MAKWTLAQRQDVVRLRESGMTYREVGNALEMSEESARGIYRRGISEWMAKDESHPVVIDALIEKAQVENYLADGYEITKVMAREWGSPEAPRFYAGVELKPNKAATSLKQLTEGVIERISQHAPIYTYETQGLVPTGSGVMREFSLYDAHMGKLAWGPETHTPYDMKITTDRMRKSFYTLLERSASYHAERALVVVGQDLLHIDNLLPMTHTGNNILDADSRYHKMFYRVIELYVEFIEVLATYGDVDVLVVPGNHDTLASFHVGAVLEAWFRQNDRVKIDNSPKLRKYYQWGKVLLGITHGHHEKVKDLPLIMAREQKRAWGETEFREIHIGHLHKRREYTYISLDEEQEVSVRHLPSISENDAWHDQKGYGALKRSVVMAWDEHEGLIGDHYVNFPTTWTEDGQKGYGRAEDIIGRRNPGEG